MQETEELTQLQHPEFRTSKDDSTARICPQLQLKHCSQILAQRATPRGGIRGQACFEAVEQAAALQLPNTHGEKSYCQSAIPVTCPSTVHQDGLPFNFLTIKSH